MVGYLCGILHGSIPVAAMVAVQATFAGVNILYKLAVNDGMNLEILIVYRNIFGAAFLIPLAFFVERNSRSPMSWTIFFLAFLCGLFGAALSQNLCIRSLSLTSATFVSAMTNLTPAITFIMAAFFGLEKFSFGTLSGQAKILGTIIGISGAMILTFYKGVEIHLWSTCINLSDNQHQHQGGQQRVIGSLLAIGTCLCNSIWLILQTKLSAKYPPYSSTALMCFMGFIQSMIYALFMERESTKWKLGWNIRLLTCVYSGALASGLMVTVMAWCIQLRGPLFVSIFNPLMLVIVTLVGSLILNEELHLGSVLGAAVITIGLYMVLWGKGQEERNKDADGDQELCDC
ncbi:WAT1-related protein At1g68170-like [Tasmannia lanceolata]|uniref:WAT1-related protein At1g68170-like n=1 Tax=Tasmannia lanceolata TaxID=3420 RepID=UPI004062AC95